ncbi:MAG: hypothetical protein COA73_02890 [Candidatus Hydrogenedentota bacterium]|nr:MAG: hypothetical protein COA73_02890 [Candidatus Hydrogenedentota bacterium]
MDKVRKFFFLVWNTKERIVLAVVVCVLSYRVYSMLNPPDEMGKNTSIPQSPQRTVDEADIDIPGNPPPAPKDELPENWNNLHRRPGFVFILPSGNSDDTSGNSQTDEIKLLDIQDLGQNRYRARIQTGSGRPRYYPEGEKFQSYELISIDPDTGCCIVFSESVSKEIEICIQTEE